MVSANGQTRLLHRLIIETDRVIDHINGDGLDNRRANLRPCLRRENVLNSAKTGLPTTSRYKGVCWLSRTRKWQAYIKVNRKQRSLGYFDNEVDAALAYNAAARIEFGEFAWLNPVEPIHPGAYGLGKKRR